MGHGSAALVVALAQEYAEPGSVLFFRVRKLSLARIIGGLTILATGLAAWIAGGLIRWLIGGRRQLILILILRRGRGALPRRLRTDLSQDECAKYGHSEKC